MKVLAVIGALGAFLVLAFFGCDHFLLGGVFWRERAAIRFAESVDEARLMRLIDDCRAIANGRPLVPAAKQKDTHCYACMWDDKTGYPQEFRDFRPLAAFVDVDSVTLITFKAWDSSVAVDVTDLRSASPRVAMRYGDTFRPRTKVLWEKKPNKAPEPTP